MKLKALLFLFLSSCGTDLCEKADWRTTQDICVFTNSYNIDKDKLSRVIDVTETTVSARHPKKYDELRYLYGSMNISFVPDLGEKIDGYCKYQRGALVADSYEIVAEFKETELENCEWHYLWIIPHEMIHAYRIGIDNEPQHKRGWHVSENFTPEENESSIQYEVYKKLTCDLCGLCD